MESYCLKCRKYTKNIKCAISNSKKSKFINKQESSELLSKLSIKTP